MALVEGPHYWQDPPIRCSDGGSTVWRATQGKLRYKAEFELRASVDETVALLSAVERKSEWDGACETAEVVAERDDGCRAFYLRTKANWTTSSREEVLWMVQRTVGNGGILLLTTTCEEYPVRGKGVRMRTEVGGQLVAPHGEDGSKVTMLLDTDPGGSLSSAIIKQISTKRVPKNISNIRRILEQRRG